MQKIVRTTILKILRPLARFLLRNGVSLGEFAELARRAYVETAHAHFHLPGRKQTTSRVSVLTGLSRKEVKRILDSADYAESSEERKYNRAARVISGWRRDQLFLDQAGNPAELPFEGEGRDFFSLVKKYSGDLPPRAILDELIRVKAVEKTENGLLRLLSRAYIPHGMSGEKIAALGLHVADLVNTIDHNIAADSPPRLQRAAAYDNVPGNCLPEIRELIQRKGQEVLEEIDLFLAMRDRDVNPEITGKGRVRVGMGVYYFEEPSETKEEQAS